MKHTLLIAMISAGLMAETPKPAPKLNELEMVGLSAVMAEAQRLTEAQQALGKRYAGLVEEQCKKHYEGKPCDITREGTVVLKPEPVKPEVKK